MTDKEAMKLAKILANIEDYRVTMTAAHEIRRLHFENKKLKERLADPMREVQRLGQEIEQEPDRTGMVYYKNDACKAKDAYADDCICWTKAQPPQRTEQEPVELPCCGYTDASAIKWNSFNGVVQCHNCGQTYTPPAPQRTEPLIGCVNHDCAKCKEKNT